MVDGPKSREFDPNDPFGGSRDVVSQDARQQGAKATAEYLALQNDQRNQPTKFDDVSTRAVADRAFDLIIRGADHKPDDHSPMGLSPQLGSKTRSING